jgi:hypothetical protein
MPAASESSVFQKGAWNPMAERKTASDAFAKAEDALQRIDSHEAICAERYKNINDTLGEVKGAVKEHQRAAWGVVIALIAWMALELWNKQVTHPTPQAVAAEVAK